MSRALAVIAAGGLVAFKLGAQPPTNFEASVKAAMASSIAQQRAAVQKQALLSRPPGASSSSSPSPSFFSTSFDSAAVGSVNCDPLPREQLDPLIEQAAQKTGVEADLVRAVIEQESAGRPCALSAKGAQGLMQLMPATADEYEVDDPFDPQQNVEAGAKLLRSLLNRYQNDPALALGAYNAGSSRVDQQGGVPPIQETTDYVTAILEKLRAISAKIDSGETGSSASHLSK